MAPYKYYLYWPAAWLGKTSGKANGTRTRFEIRAKNVLSSKSSEAWQKQKKQQQHKKNDEDEYINNKFYNLNLSEIHLKRNQKETERERKARTQRTDTHARTNGRTRQRVVFSFIIFSLSHLLTFRIKNQPELS